ncbi:MAG TPA: MBL fold metallo-hydrolase [Chitinophagaceae bacterium]|jgi:glyoxylase-like metal-dependent hydrolase (beta-lactamase superfamily II)|nr:MBL fold metallo-hydrolase [Chitinophagaceae bacterium]
MKIIPLSEGTFTIDKSKLFVPFNKETDDLQERSVGSLLVEIQPFLVITENDILLLDTGLGFEKNGVLQIHENLARHQINATDVTKVLMTHLHKDHAGGVSREDKLSSMHELSFPNATYFVQRRELDFALEKGFPSFIPGELEILKDSKQVVLLDADRGQIDEAITYEVTGAHAPFHQVFWIKADAQTIFFGGDDAPQLQQMKHRFVAKYDYNGKKAAQLRQQWWEQGAAERWTFLFYHDVKNPVWSF